MVAALIMISLLALFLLAGAPVFVALGISAVVAFLIEAAPLQVSGQLLVSTLASFTLLAVPLFILMAEIMNHGGLVARLVRLLDAFVGHIRGGLGVVAVLTSAIFAAFSGSSAANAAALGVTLVPQMKEAGYDPRFSAGLVAAGGTLGILIPPSINMILYSAVTGLPILELFQAGILPGIILTGMFIVIAIVFCWWKQYPKRPPVPWEERWRRLGEDGPLLLIPVVVLGAIYSGILTVTEAAIAGIGFALMLQVLWYRNFSLPQLGKALVQTAKTTSMIYLIIGTAAMFAHVLTLSQAPQWAAGNLSALLDMSQWLFFLAAVAFLIILGAFIDVAAITYVAVPIFDLALKLHGLDRIQFAIVFVITMELGLITPPIGLNTFIISSVSRQSISAVAYGAWPFCVAMLVAIVLVILLPGLTS
ncbi:MAG: TRAP transporter large permease [Alphaproteobacteria bacterium]